MPTGQELAAPGSGRTGGVHQPKTAAPALRLHGIIHHGTEQGTVQLQLAKKTAQVQRGTLGRLRLEISERLKVSESNGLRFLREGRGREVTRPGRRTGGPLTLPQK